MKVHRAPTLTGWLPILMYHSVAAREPLDDPEHLLISVGRLRRQLEGLLEAGYRPVPLMQAIGRSAPAAPKTFAVTFDDGYRDNLELAFPVLADLDVPATLFVLSDCLGGHSRWNRSLHAPLLSARELREVQAAGVSIGSHGCVHLRLTRLTDEEAKHQIVDSKLRLGDLLGETLTEFAFPCNSANQRLIDEVRDSGYMLAVGGNMQPHQQHYLHRLDTWGLSESELVLAARRGPHRSRHQALMNTWSRLLKLSY